MEWNATRRDFSQVCLHELFEAQAKQTPDLLAVADPRQQLTYRELDVRANRLARHLLSLGAGPEKLVALCLNRSVAFVAGALATLKAGAAYLPLDPGTPRDRLDFMLNDANVPVVLTERRISQELPSGPWKLVTLDKESSLIDCHEAEPIASGATLDNLAYVIYTSGSTGQPKGVEITHRSLLNLVLWHQRAFTLAPADRATQLASPAFDAAVWELWPYLTAGASIHIPDETVRLSAAVLRDWLVENRISITFAPTALAEQLLALEWPGKVCLRFMLTGGDKLRSDPPPTLPFVLVNNYGPTEATVVTTSGLVPVCAHEDQDPSIGKPISNTTVYLLDDHLRPVAVGEMGEIYIGGAGVARGYLNRPELTAQRFIPDPFCDRPGARMYKSGDLARYRLDGALEFVGRVDNQVKVRGFRVELGEIEGVLGEHPGIEAAVMTSQEGERGQTRLVAYVVARSSPPPSSEELRGYLKKKLPEWMLPARFEFLPALPLTPSGKVDRLALPAPGRSREALASLDSAPLTEVEKKLERIFASTLGLDWVGSDEDFFDAGGSSLLAGKLGLEVEKALGRKVTLATLFSAPTVRELAAVLSQPQPSQAIPGVLRLQPSGSRPPFFCLGGARNFRALANRMGPDQPFVGLVFEEEELAALRAPYRAEDFAAFFVRKIRLLQPKGPYYVGSGCAPALIAYEMAQQLRAQGEEVLLVVFGDPKHAYVPKKGYAARVSWYGRKISVFISRLRSRGTLRSAAAYLRVHIHAKLWMIYYFFRFRLRYKLHALAGVPIGSLARQEAGEFAVPSYRPQPFSGKIALIRSELPPEEFKYMPDDLGWSDLAKGGVEVQLVPGDVEEILKEPNVEITAMKLREILLKAQEALAVGGPVNRV